MFEDDTRPASTPSISIGDNLSPLSINELEERIALLREEIGRIENELASKRDGLAAADAVFGAGG